MVVKSVFCFLTTTVICTIAQDILVTLPNGMLVGRKEYSLRNISFYSFQGIPFAKPPLGPLRFMAPQPAEKWDGVLDAISENKICYQQTASVDTSYVETEDCLYLNVYTPEFPDTNVSLPVMVYIFGGGFVNGDAVFWSTGPHYLLEHDVVVVTLAYRVGPFGFISTGDTVIPGNYGLKDQNLGLKWVQENIQYFGGDPSQVTIFGESAGGASVTYQLMSNWSEGLFRAAISQSGSVLCPWAYQREYKNYAYGLATFLNQSFSTEASSQELLDYLQSLPASEIKRAHDSFQDVLGNNQILQGFWYTPVIEPEHEGAFLTESMYAAVAEGHMNRVPLMIGICSEEQLAWASGGAEGLKYTMQGYDQNVSLLVNRNMHLKTQAQLTDAGEAIRKLYTDGLLQDNPAPSIYYLSDMGFNRPIIHHARLQSQFSDVYFYMFSYHGQLGNNNVYIEGAERVEHAEDNKYVWVSQNQSNLNSYPKSDILASDRFITLLTNFAKTLNPTPEKSELLQNITWPKATPTNFRYLNINDTLSIEVDPKNDRYVKWVALYEDKAVKPYDTF